jgi:dTDP-4-amino-4,6-dideoxygalactose transaminase
MKQPPVVPLVDLGAQFEEVRDEVSRGFTRLTHSTAFVGGPDVAEFERTYAEFSGVRHCIGVANGTDALELALRAVGVTRGSEVIVPANSFIATAEAVSRAGAVPVFVDVDEHRLLIDPAAVERSITPSTKAVIPVHLFGQMAPVETVRDVVDDQRISVVEDAAQSQGARREGRASGGAGRISATSFYPGKNLGAAGDAGAVTTDEECLADLVRLMASHGSRRKYVHEVVGFNSRLDSIQAVVLNAKLPRLEQWNSLRRHAADRYARLLSDVEDVRCPLPMPGNEHVWHLYVVRVPDRDRVLKALEEAGVGAGIHYPVPLHLTGAYANRRFPAGSCPVAEAAARQIISLPIYPHITADQQIRVVDVLAKACRGRI